MPSSILHHPSSLRQVLLIACVWTAGEWVRGNLFSGFPWSFVGHTHTPLLPLVQIADVFSAYGVTFVIVALNAWVAVLVVERLRLRAVLGAGVVVVVMIAASLAYGFYRLSQDATQPGPRVLVVQANFPQSNTGEKGATDRELVEFHIEETLKALKAEEAAGRKVDLVAWSETMLPPLNRQARDLLNGYDYGKFLEEVIETVADVAFKYDVAILAGGNYFEAIDEKTGLPMRRRNVAYYFNKTGLISDLRYDKIHLVPFGEYIPFKHTVPPLYRMFIHFGPHDFDYTVTPGEYEKVTVFPVEFGRDLSLSPVRGGEGRGEGQGALEGPTTRDVTSTSPLSPPLSPEYRGEGENRTARFVAPICFEDVDPRLVARMFRGEHGSKRADFIVNITNDGWFSQPQLSQHLQIARFRSIENRVPTARSVNTGISAFIDSNGRVYQRLAAQVEGTSVANLRLDDRVTVYTRFGDWFAGLCTIVTAVVVVWSIVQSRLRRRRSLVPSPAAPGGG